MRINSSPLAHSYPTGYQKILSVAVQRAQHLAASLLQCTIIYYYTFSLIDGEGADMKICASMSATLTVDLSQIVDKVEVNSLDSDQIPF